MSARNDEFGRIMAEYYRKRYQQVEPAIDVALSLIVAIREAETDGGMERLKAFGVNNADQLDRFLIPKVFHTPKEP